MSTCSHLKGLICFVINLSFVCHICSCEDVGNIVDVDNVDITH
jgi:hypothetical protein